MVAGERGNKIGMLKEGNLNRPARQNTNEHSLGGRKKSHFNETFALHIGKCKTSLNVVNIGACRERAASA